MYKFAAAALLCALLMVNRPVVAEARDNLETLPDLGDTSGQIFTPQHDRKLGTAFMRQIRQAGLVLDDGEATRYLQNLGRRLAMYSENPGHNFTFFLVADPRINAFAGPGGYIGTNTGLFTAAENESELAGVLAHEIAHVTQRHLARAFDTADKLSLANTAALLAAILIGTQDSQAGAAALTAASALNIQQQINFTRANEKEADRVGIRALAGAGFDPHGMAGFFEKLQKNAKLYGTQPPEFLSTHPVTTDRIAEATSRAESYPVVNQADDHQFQLMRAKLRVAGYESPRQVLLDFQRFHGKDGGSTDVERYEYALLLAAGKQHEKAASVMRQLHRADPDRLAYRLALGRILHQAGDLESALNLYRESLSLYPGESIVILPYANTLMNAGDNEQAYTLLADLSNSAAHGPDVYKLLAQAAGKTDRPLQTHTAMAEYHYLNGYTLQAVEQMKLAQKTTSLSNYQAARIEALLKALEQELNEKD
ncbi:MAG: M48 family metalloprotease [Gammaproteobacteria bacterium]|nr:M48 family metalloprotease [Gammaproteobacteria bacterium]